MMLVRAGRILSCILAVLALLFGYFCLWGAISDYQMQLREHWQFKCYDIIEIRTLVAFLSVVITAISWFAYGKFIAWQHRLHGTR